MTRPNLLILLGILVILAPYAGLPSSWLELILPVIGVAIVAIGYAYRPKRASAEEATNLEALPAN